VVKPLAMEPAALAWQGELLADLDGRTDFRVSVPLPALDGSWTVSGWTAWQYQPGRHLAQRWHGIVNAGQRLHAALPAEPEPAFLRRRTDRWSIGDKVAWGELPAAQYAATKHLSRLAAALRPLHGRCQLIHGDLTGTVLFEDDLPPLVIDLSPYWRPPAYASAIVIADALVFEGAGNDVVEPLLQDPAFPQYLLRALIYRPSLTTWPGVVCTEPMPTILIRVPSNWASNWPCGFRRRARPCRPPLRPCARSPADGCRPVPWSSP